MRKNIFKKLLELIFLTLLMIIVVILFIIFFILSKISEIFSYSVDIEYIEDKQESEYFSCNDMELSKKFKDIKTL